MKGMILAAGLGTRMGPVTQYLAKPAIPFLGTPLIEHSIGVMRAGGITDIVINIHHLPETLTSLLGDGSRLGVKLEYSLENPLLGSGGGVGKVKDFFAGEPFALLNSDILLDLDLGEIIKEHEKSGADSTMVLRPDPDDQYSKVIVDETGRVRKIEGYPETSDFYGGKGYMFCGLHIAGPAWFEFAPESGPYETFPDVYSPMLVAGRKINSYISSGRWVDVGTAPRFIDATKDELVRSIIPSKATIGEGTEITASVLTKATTVGSSASLDGVICLAEASIGDNCQIKDSILCPEAVIPAGTVGSNMIFHEETATKISDIMRL
jgi:mannose-1-phosphate guanylyltransferase